MNLLDLEATPQLDNKTKKEIKKNKNIVTRIKNTFLHIKSHDRNKIASNVLDMKIYNLPLNPIKITAGSNNIIINIPNHKLKIDDKIIIENVVSTSVIQSFTLTLIENILYITAPENTAGYNLIQYIITTYNTDIQVEISGVIGEDSITKELNGLYLFNVVPINLINTRHNILYSTTINNKLNTIFINLDMSPYTSTISGIKTFQITLLTIGGIPLNQINANFPLDTNHLYGYHDIKHINGDYITITTYTNATNSLIGGGDKVVISNIINQIVEYPTPDYYEITLLKNFRRVSEIKVMSSEIPFTVKNVTNLNKFFYWTNLIDGEHINTIEIPEGLYNSNELLHTLVSLINTVPINNTNNKSHYFTYTINNLNYTLYSGISTQLYQPLEVDSIISTSQALTRYMYINFDYHNLSDGDTITIKGAISFRGIPANIINSTYTVTVVNQNKLKVILPNYNTELATENVNNGGGNIVNVVILNDCKLINGSFNIFNLLGLSITNTFKSSFTNYKPILNSLYPYIELRCILPNTNNDNYNYIDSQPILTKIQLKGNIGEYLYNKHTDISLMFEPPLNDLSTITFQFVYPDGTQVDFMNTEHSFTLLISELFDSHLDSLLDTIK